MNARAILTAYGVFLYLPIAVLAVFSFNAASVMAFPLSGFTLDWYVKLARNAAFLGGFVVSFLIAQPVAFASTALGALAAFALTARDLRWRAAFAVLLALPFLIPKGVLAIGQLMILNRLGIERGVVPLIAAQTLTFMPFAAVIVGSVLIRVDPRLEEAARDLGATAWQTLRLVTLPLIGGALGAAYSVSLILSLGDLTLASFLSGRTQPLSVIVASAFRRELSPELNALQVVMLVLTLAMVVASEAARRHRSRSAAPPRRPA